MTDAEIDALRERAGEVLEALRFSCLVSAPGHSAATVSDLLTALLTANVALRAERDEADRRAGAAERELADKRDTISKLSQARDEMKRQRGYDYTVSFDRVWKETCEKAARAEAAEAVAEKLRAERDEYKRLAAAGELAAQECRIWQGQAQEAYEAQLKAEARAERLEAAMRKLHHAVCGETGFAACVRLDSGKAYPWPALDDADEAARAALTETATTEERG